MGLPFTAFVTLLMIDNYKDTQLSIGLDTQQEKLERTIGFVILV